MPGVGRVLVVIPTYNEADNIGAIVDRVRRAVPRGGRARRRRQQPRRHRGASPTTWPPPTRQVHVLHRPGKQGLGAAYLAGFAWARERRLRRRGRDGRRRLARPGGAAGAAGRPPADADVVLGSRWVRGGQVVNWPLRRLLLSRGGNLYARLRAGHARLGRHRRLPGCTGSTPWTRWTWTSVVLAGLLLPGGAVPAGAPGGAAGGGGADHVRRAGARRQQDEPVDRASRRCGGSPSGGCATAMRRGRHAGRRGRLRGPGRLAVARGRVMLEGHVGNRMG